MCRNFLLLFLVGLGFFAFNPQIWGDEPKRTVSAIIADLKKGEKEKLQAIQELEAMGEKAAEAASPLVDLLSTNNEDVRLGVIFALGKIGKAAVAPLTKATTSKDGNVRFY